MATGQENGRENAQARLPAVAATATAAFIAISAFSELAQQPPTDQSKIPTNIRSAKDTGAGRDCWSGLSGYGPARGPRSAGGMKKARREAGLSSS